jgi:hypothetical protein
VCRVHGRQNDCDNVFATALFDNIKRVSSVWVVLQLQPGRRAVTERVEVKVRVAQSLADIMSNIGRQMKGANAGINRV